MFRFLRPKVPDLSATRVRWDHRIWGKAEELHRGCFAFACAQCGAWCPCWRDFSDWVVQRLSAQRLFVCRMCRAERD